MEPTHEDMTDRVERILDKIYGAITMALITPVAVFLVGWILVMAAFILGRAFDIWHPQFVEEFSIYLVVLCTFFGIPYALRRGAHIKVDFVTRHLPQRVQDILAVITYLLAVLVVAYLTQKGYMWFWVGFVKQRHSQFPSNLLQWPFYITIPIGYGTLTLGLLLEFYRSILRLVKGVKEAPKKEWKEAV